MNNGYFGIVPIKTKEKKKKHKKNSLNQTGPHPGPLNMQLSWTKNK